jgi:hypothetical protein
MLMQGVLRLQTRLEAQTEGRTEECPRKDSSEAEAEWAF